MKSFAVLAFLITSTFGQRLSILSPVPMAEIPIGSSFVASLREDQTLSSISQVSVSIAATACYDVCNDTSKWGGATVLYYGAFDPQYNDANAQNGLYQDFNLSLPQGWPAGESVLQVSHLFTLGAGETLSFDYTDVHFNVTAASL